jgi:hypothetical protein
LDIIQTQYLLYVFAQSQVVILFLLVDGSNGLHLIKLVFMVMKLELGAVMNIVHLILLPQRIMKIMMMNTPPLLTIKEMKLWHFAEGFALETALLKVL